MIDVFAKYVWVKPQTNKKTKTVLNDFIGTVNKFKYQPNKLWVDQGREFYNKFMQKWLVGNDVLMYLTYNEVKSVVWNVF